MSTDLEIAQSNKMENISVIAKKLGLQAEDLDFYGNYKAKLNFKTIQRILKTPKNKQGKLVLVTALTPTAAGEGKSTISIALADGLQHIGKKSVLALREPSLGPCFGIKGGACGGGHAQIVPMEDINLHFTGDIHAISIATNLIATLIDNHIYQGNKENIDSRTITWKRCLDLNDRSLRNIVVGLGKVTDGVPREDHFTIAVASEIMAILCLATNIADLKRRLNNIVIGKRFDKTTVYLKDLHSAGAIATLLKDAFRPNLVQTLEKTPAFVHGGPFANIAHGCNSILATKAALSFGEYTITEAGFAADLGAEKFLDIKCPVANIIPNCVVIVASIRALKLHGGVDKTELSKSNVIAVQKGFENLQIHIQNIRSFGLPCLVAINKFTNDTDQEIQKVQQLCSALQTPALVSDAWKEGGRGAIDLAKAVVEICEQEQKIEQITRPYKKQDSLKQKIEQLAQKIYRAGRVEFSSIAEKKLIEYEKQGYGELPICMAKTQNSISHDKTLLGAPSGYTFPISDVQLFGGAEFIVVFAGSIMTMPGLPAQPAALNIDIDDEGNISGLF